MNKLGYAVMLFISLVMIIENSIITLRKKRFSIFVLLSLLFVPSVLSIELSDIKYCFDWEGATETIQMQEKINSFQCTNVGVTVETEHFLSMGQKSILGAGDQYVYCGKDNVTPGGFQKLSACAWFNITDAEGTGTDSYIIGTRGNNRPFLMLASVYPSYKRVYITIDSDTSSPVDIDTPYNSYLFGALKDFFCVVWNGTHVLKYRQGLANGTPTAYSGNYLASTDSNFYVGRQGTSQGLEEFIGHIGDIYLWNGTLDAAQILDLYQSPRENCAEFVSAPPNETAIFPLLSVSAFNASYPNVDTHSFKEGVRFYGKANFTFNGSILSSATCNFSYKNVSEMGFYNSTKEMYLNKTGYVDYAHGITNLTAFCKQGSYNASGSWYIDIENIAPSVSINSVVDADGNTYTMSEGVFLEFIDGDYTWNISIDDDDLDYYLITLRNSTDVIQSGTSIPFTNDGLLFVDFHQNPFNISVFANDSAGDSSYQSFTFNINDTSMPVCTTLVDASIENSSVYKVNVSCSDEYLFSYNLSCDNTNIFSKYQADIFNTTYIYYNSSLIDLGEGQINCWYEYCDGHTAELISDIDINVPKGNLINNQIMIDNKIIKVDSAVAKWTYEKKSDRITFCSEFTEPIYEASYEIPSGCYPALNSKWKGHLVCPETRTWIDYNNKDYDVQITNKVKVIFNKQTNKACFDSVGKFNCVTGTFTINITLPLTNSSSRLKIGYCPDTTASVLILFIFLIISLVLLVLGFIIRSGFLLFFSGIFLIALSWYLSDCQSFLALITALFGIMIIIVSITFAFIPKSDYHN